MDSNINANGFFNPRYYQIIKDRIESKQTMEPISITHGGGVVCGFNVFDFDKPYFSITGDNNPAVTEYPSKTIARLISGQRQTSIAVNNLKGQVVNAHFTPSGLLSVDPEVLDFPAIPIDWGNANQSPKLVILKSKHVYNNTNPISSPPSIEDFEVMVIDRTQDDITYSAANLLQLSYETLMAKLADKNCFIYEDTEVLIGIYQIGNTNEDLTGINSGFYRYIRKACDRIKNKMLIQLDTPPPLPLVYYNKTWPVSANNFLYDKYLNKATSDIVEDLSSRVDDLEQPINADRIQAEAISVLHMDSFSKRYLVNEQRVGLASNVVTDNNGLAALNNLDVTEIYIRKGQYSINSSIKLHPNVKRVIMDPAGVININAPVGFYKDNVDYEASYHGLNVNLTYNVADNVVASAYRNLCNMHNCIGKVNRRNNSTSLTQNQIIAKVYDTCYNLTECIASATANTQSICMVDIFYKCSDMINCRDTTNRNNVLIPEATQTSTDQCYRITGGFYSHLIRCTGVSKTLFNTHSLSSASLTINPAYNLDNTPNGGFNLSIPL